MAKKHDRRRRSLKEAQLRGEKSFALPRSSSAVGRKAQPQPLRDGGRRAGRLAVIAICCLLALAPTMIFVQTWQHGFVNCDDSDYIEKNVDIQRGLTPASAWWAMTQARSANWHPLTWMSHMIDWRAFGTWDANRQRYVDSWPGGHHLVNLFLHASCAVLLFLVLQAMTGATWPSAMVAALFAVHPLRVESVAWATERKDTLSALFFLLTLAAYRAYAVRRFCWWRYGLVIVSFYLGLTAKSMLVTMPLVLLLVDYWPLRRIFPPRPGDAAAGSFSGLLPPRVILEKLPLLALSAWSCYLTMWAQGLVAAFKPLDFQYRLGNALLSYAAYIQQMFYPAGMVVQYVHPGPKLQWQATLIPLLLLVSITLAVVWLGWRRRYLAVGWFWYLGMLVPVIGLVQVGAQARADRYTYLTQIGLYIMIAWGLRDLARAWRSGVAWYAALAVPVMAALAVAAWLQTSYWRNSLTLWEHCVACQPENDYAEYNYGQALDMAGRSDEAMEHFRKSFEINPLYLPPRTDYAAGLWKRNKPAEAIDACEEVITIDPNNAPAHAVRALALYSLKRPDESIQELQTAIQIDPTNADTQSNLAHILLAAKNDLEGAREHFEAGLKLAPENPKLHDGLATVLWRQGKFQEAVAHRKQQVALQPGNAATAVKVARDLISDPRTEARFGADALEIARRACELTQDQDIFALDVLAAAYAEMGDFDQAQATVRKAMQTPLGHTKNNPQELQRRLDLYRGHQKLTILPP